MVLSIRDLLLEIGWTLMPIHLELEKVAPYTAESQLVIDLLSHDNSAVGTLQLKRQSTWTESLSRPGARSIVEEDLLRVLMDLERTLDPGDGRTLDSDVAGASSTWTRFGSQC